MKYIKSLAVAALALTTSMSSCDMGDFGNINVDPTLPSQGYTSMLFTYSAKSVRSFTMNSSTYDPWTQFWTGYLAESKNNQYGGLMTTVNYSTRDWYRYYIKNLNTIIEMNQNEETRSTISVTSFGSNNNQIATAMTLRAFIYMTLTDIVGPLPYSEAFKGESDGIWSPKFDSQEDIYAALDKELQDAHSMFDTNGSLTSADILYHGDISKWKKFNATLRMMMAIKLADVAPEVGKSRFVKAYADGGMKDASDGFHFTFSVNADYAWLYYTGNPNYGAADLNMVPNQVIVEALKEYNDPRMFSYFTLDGYKGKVDGDPYDFNAYKGVAFGHDSEASVMDASQGCCSVAYSYCEADATYGIITTARSLLVEAEAATLGWIEADAKALYEAGIRASFDFQGMYHTPIEGVDEYIASEKVALSNDKETALSQIIMQRFLAGFMTDGIESWSDWRRYNIPVLPMLPAHEINLIDVYPYRMQYADADKESNEENVKVAIDTWLNGEDDRWQRVWWDVADNH